MDIAAEAGLDESGGVGVVGVQFPAEHIIDPIQAASDSHGVAACASEVIGQTALMIIGIEVPSEEQLARVIKGGGTGGAGAGFGEGGEED